LTTSSILHSIIYLQHLHCFPQSLAISHLLPIKFSIILPPSPHHLHSIPLHHHIPSIFTILFLINSIHHHLLPFSIHFYPFTLFITCPCFSVCPSCTATFINFLCLTLFLYLACCLACPLYSTHLAMVCPYTGLP